MSLQLAAQHLAARGRGDDKVLVHMTHGEVKSLNDLAKHHGGQLTTNPQTGLPEAGFLSSMLPMLIGAGLAAATGGSSLAVSGGLFGMGMPATIGMGIGGLQALRTGSLGQGIMAGLGAYGGASMAGAAGLGEAAAAPNATPTATNGTQVAPTNIVNGSGQAISAAPIAAPVAAPVAAPINDPNGLTLTNAESTLASNPTADSVAPKPYAPFEANYPYTPDAAAAPKPFSPIDWAKDHKYTAAGMAASVASGMQKDPLKPTTQDANMGQRYSFTGGAITPTPAPDVPSYNDMMTKQGNFGRQQKYFNNPTYTPISDTAAKDLYHFADGGMPVEQMSNNAAIGANTMYPMANMATSAFATPYQTPQSTNMMSAIAPSGGGTVDQMSGEPNMQGTRLASGGISDAHYNLGDYSDGGRLLRGPGDGVSDSIPAVIGKKQPARLADGEFVVPARVVSELGNGSTEAGARKLYAMMDRIQASRKHTVGKGKVAKNNRADRYLPA